jgi:hypothetical protein
MEVLLVSRDDRQVVHKRSGSNLLVEFMSRMPSKSASFSLEPWNVSSLTRSDSRRTRKADGTLQPFSVRSTGLSGLR